VNLIPRSRSLIAASALVAAVAACGDAGLGTVATVNGDAIVVGEVTGLRNSYAGDVVNTNTEQFRTDLGNVIFLDVLVAAAEEQYDITFTEAEVRDRLANPPERYAQVFAQVEADADLTDDAKRHQALISLIRDSVTNRLVADDATFWDDMVGETPELLTSACVRHVLVATEGEAAQIIDRLQGGEDFAAVADEVSLDTASAGGALVDQAGECMLPLQTYVAEFGNAAATAVVGEVSGPVQTQFGFHVILVDRREDPPPVEVLEADPVAYLGNTEVSSLFSPWFNDVVRAATIEIDPVVGSWSTSGVGIVPPE
jgi:parvulin-like peptidyl-prolyl isomerase